MRIKFVREEVKQPKQPISIEKRVPKRLSSKLVDDIIANLFAQSVDNMFAEITCREADCIGAVYETYQ